VDDHARDILGTSLVYPVHSRRSGGLSIGINLFPERKTCTFDCPYCEVFPPDAADSGSSVASGGIQGSGLGDRIPLRLERDLHEFFDTIYPRSFAPEPIRDLCISGNGEPTVSPHLKACLGILESLRLRHPESLSDVPIVVITNSTGFLSSETCAILADSSARGKLDIWAKLDAGDRKTFGLMSGSGYEFDEILSGLLAFSLKTPVIVQSMLCSVGDFTPDLREIRSRAGILAGLLEAKAMMRELHLYTLARPACHPGVRPLPDGAMLEAARVFASILPPSFPVRSFGSRGSLS
jgi:histidinol dehydrogenase